MRHIILSIFIIFTIGGCGSKNVEFNGSDSADTQTLANHINPIGIDNTHKAGAKNKLSGVLHKTVVNVITFLPHHRLGFHKTGANKKTHKKSYNVKKSKLNARTAKKGILYKTLPKSKKPVLVQKKGILYKTQPKSKKEIVVGKKVIKNPRLMQTQPKSKKEIVAGKAVVKNPGLVQKKGILYKTQPKSKKDPVLVQAVHGHSGLVQKGSLYIAPKVDIIFAIDNTLTMHTFLKQVPNTFSDFIHSLSGVDWQIMFTTNKKNDIKQPKNRDFYYSSGESIALEYAGEILDTQSRYLNSGVENAESIFIDTLRIHESHEYTSLFGYGKKPMCSLPPYCDLSEGNNEPLKSLINSFSYNTDYFRNGADVVAVIVSDWYNAESNINVDNAQSNMQIKAKNIIKEFKQKWGNSKKLVVYGISLDTCKSEACKAAYSADMIKSSLLSQKEFIKVVNLTGGKTYSFYSSKYTDLAKQIVHDFGGL